MSPGGELAPLGLLVIGTTIGGNALAVATASGEVVFADSSHFLTRIADEYEVQIRGEWQRVPTTREGVLGICTLLSIQLESFLTQLLADELLEVLEDLD